MSQPESPGDSADKRGRRKRRRSRRRRQGESRRGFALLPQILTTGNLAAGFYAIIMASTGSPLWGSYAIFLAGIFDMLDGRAARLTGSTSRFGAEYDSIADTVSFGVAPAVIAFHAGGMVGLGWEGWVAAFVYTACAALRLARFNVSQGRYEGRFDGMPSPMAAGMVVSTVWFDGHLDKIGWAVDLHPVFPALGLAAVGLLMVSPIPYHSFKNLNVRGSYRNLVTVVIFLLLILAKPQVSCFLVAIAYVASGPLEVFWRQRTGRPLLPLEPVGDTAGEAGSGASLRSLPGRGADDE